MKTAILLPLILSAGANSVSPVGSSSTSAQIPEPIAILEGCGKSIWDTREASKILFNARLEESNKKYGRSGNDTRNDQLYVSHCGDEFVLFTRTTKDESSDGHVVYMRFKDKTYELVGEYWG